MSSSRLPALAATLLLLFPGAVPAKGQAPRLHFNNIEIAGTADAMRAELEADGYTVAEVTDAGIRLRGAYLGHDGCDIYIIPAGPGGPVCRLSVYLPARERWSELKADYEAAKASLPEGALRSDSYEYFIGSFREGDGRELRAFNEEQASRQAFRDYEAGTVSVSVVSLGTTRAQVRITFEDAQGMSLLQESTK